MHFMKKYYKKSMFHVLSIIIILTMSVGCLPKNKNEVLFEHDSNLKQTSDKTIVTFFGYKSDSINLIAIEKALCEFMDYNQDIYVTYEGLKGMSYWEAFELRDKTGNLDDIIMLDHERIISLSEEGHLVDLSALPTLDNYIPWTKSQFTNEDGSVYFLPTCISTYNLYINTDLLKQHGQKIPTNLEEFTEVCDYFVSKGITPIIANNYASIPSIIIAKGMNTVYGSENSAEKIEKFNSGEADLAEQLRPGVEFAKLMFERGWLDGGEVADTAQTSDDLALFSKGDRPFMISGGWASVRLKVDFSYGVYPYPILDDGSVMAMSVDTCIGINAGSSHIEEALKLVEFLTQPAVMWNYCDSQCSYSPLTDNRTPSDKTIAPSAPYLTNGRIVLRSDYNLNFQLESALRECSSKIMKGADAESVMKLLYYLLYSEAGGNN